MTSEKDKKFNMMTITPVSIKMIENSLRNAIDDALYIDGTKIDHVFISLYFAKILKIKCMFSL